jgi:hypothetical protein
MTSLVKNELNENFEKEIIKVVVLDDFIENKKIDLIKMDIE